MVIVFILFYFFLFPSRTLKVYLFGIYSYLHYIDTTDRMDTVVYSRYVYHATICPTSYNTIDLHPVPRKACMYVCKYGPAKHVWHESPQADGSARAEIDRQVARQTTTAAGEEVSFCWVGRVCLAYIWIAYEV